MSESGSPPFVVPDAIEPVLGWKAWTPFPRGSAFADRPMELRSPSYPTLWEPRKPKEAVCSRSVNHLFPELQRTTHSRSVPVESCTCGIYLTHSPYIAAAYGTVLGRVYGWGKVVEHKYGWRVQYAYPERIITFFPYAFADYGVPVDVLSWPEWKELTRMDDEQKELFQLLYHRLFGEFPESHEETS